MRNLALLFASVILPDRCALCATWLTLYEPGVCGACLRDVPSASAALPDGVDALVSAASFESDVRDAILALKYRRQVWRARGLGVLLAAAPGASDLLSTCDGVCHAPTTVARTRSRGFDHATRIATSAARSSGRVVRYGLLVRRDDGRSQTGRGRRERAEAIDAIEARGTISGTWVVIDDVVTTGATLAGCARALRAAGASRVVALTVAATPPRGAA